MSQSIHTSEQTTKSVLPGDWFVILLWCGCAVVLAGLLFKDLFWTFFPF